MNTDQLPLFPDLLDRTDPFGRNLDLSRGYAVWSIDSLPINRPRHGPEYVCLVVVYDERRHDLHKTPEHWDVELRHYREVEETVVTGWGNSRRSAVVNRQRVRYVTRSLATREQAIDLAHKIIRVFNTIRTTHDEE